LRLSIGAVTLILLNFETMISGSFTLVHFDLSIPKLEHLSMRLVFTPKQQDE
jgi:hypothetical protein